MRYSFSHYKATYKELALLGLPIVVSQLGGIILGFADNIMVGRYATESLAAASFVNAMFNMAFCAIMGFSYGLTPLAGALFGRGEQRSIGALTRTALRCNVAFALAVTAIMAVLYFNLEHLGQPVELLPLIRPYYLLWLCGLVPLAVFNLLAQWLYAINNSRLPMYAVIVCNSINILGNYALIYGHWGAPEMGLTGAGIATLVARLLMMSVLLWAILGKRSYRPYREGFKAADAPAGTARRVWATSVPVSLQMAFESGSFTVAGLMTGWLGTVPLASYQIIIVIGMFGFCIYYSLGSAISVKVANATALGADRMRHIAWAGYHLMLAAMVAAMAIFVLLAKDFVYAFTEDVAVQALTLTLIVPLLLYQLGDATQVTFANALRGTSRVQPMLWIAFISYMVVGVPATYLLAFTAGLGVWGVVLSFSVSLILAGALFLNFFLRATRPKA